VSFLAIFEPGVISPVFSRDSYGRLFAYEKSYDRVTTKTERPLQLVDRIKYNTTTSDDPVIQEVRSFYYVYFLFLFLAYFGY